MIRLATKLDIPKLQQMLWSVQNLHAEGRPDVFKKGTRKYTDKDVEQIIDNPLSPIFVLDDKGVVAYSFCQIKEQEETNNLFSRKTLYIDDFCVDNDCRKKGYGTRLIGFVFDYAKKIGCDSVTLNVWALNSGAMEFYKKCGMSSLKTTMEINF